ncbi:hypothetical protein CWI39_3289p0010 [Hamiltosporidium magnivora]|uniref:RRM domain-containing protein n=1 Tax=Hamiltosporidium magnivora TaxID=148818 RepID=A0A4Q9KQX9_9MICR|nr:hypothetical protein CWI39_3289p0010 [Hamiltosporidium magnivora]
MIKSWSSDTNFRRGLSISTRIRDDRKMKLGFIEYSDNNAAIKAVESGEVELNGKKVVLSYAKKSSLPSKPKEDPSRIVQNKLYVAGFPSDMSEESLSNLFGKSCSIIAPSGTKAGYVFAEFTDEETKDNFFKEFNGKEIGTEHKLSVSPAYAKRPFHKRKYGKRSSERREE